MIFRKLAGVATIIYGVGGVLGSLGLHSAWLMLIFSLSFGVTLTLAGVALYFYDQLI